MGNQLRQLPGIPVAPDEYDKSYEDNRNRQIDANFIQLFAINQLLGTTLNLSRLPTSAAGLRSGDIWQDPAAAHVLKMVP